MVSKELSFPLRRSSDPLNSGGNAPPPRLVESIVAPHAKFKLRRGILVMFKLGTKPNSEDNSLNFGADYSLKIAMGKYLCEIPIGKEIVKNLGNSILVAFIIPHCDSTSCLESATVMLYVDHLRIPSSGGNSNTTSTEFHFSGENSNDPPDSSSKRKASEHDLRFGGTKRRKIGGAVTGQNSEGGRRDKNREDPIPRIFSQETCRD